MSGHKKIPDWLVSAWDFPLYPRVNGPPLSTESPITPVAREYFGTCDGYKILRQVSWLPSPVGGLPNLPKQDSGTLRPTGFPFVQHEGIG